MTSQKPALPDPGMPRPGRPRPRSAAGRVVSTPIYDGVVAELTSGDSPASASPAPLDHAAAEQRGAAAEPTMVIDPDTVEGAAILLLFSWLKNIEESDGSWPGGDVVEWVCAWLAAIGIDVEDEPPTAARTLRLADGLRAVHLRGSDYSVRIRTEHPAPEPIIGDALAALVTALGVGATAAVFDSAGEEIAPLIHAGPAQL